MLTGLLIILIILWFLGYIQISGLSIPDTTLFAINSHPITLWNILTLLVIAAIIGILPNPFRAIASVFLILWILSVLGILAFAGLSSLLIIAIIVGLIIYIIGIA
ncbi:MAG TPA: hypothetical protein VLF93_01145 [Candidatus Saccharimonadales bacterium]|nr:hypothetical protein [Candidatus Saccharimonadales bacterium]